MLQDHLINKGTKWETQRENTKWETQEKIENEKEDKMKRQEMEKFCSGFPKLINSPYLTALQDYLIEKDTKWETQRENTKWETQDKIRNERPKTK